MRTRGACREWRGSLGAHTLGRLDAEERAALEAHMEGCEGCREEAASLSAVAGALAHADPERLGPESGPPAELGTRVAAAIEAEGPRRRGRRLRVGPALGGAAAAVAVAAVLVLGGGGGVEEPEQEVAFGSLPAGMEIDATLRPHAYGTEIQVYVHGVRSGTLCRVFLRDEQGRRYPAGSFRYRWGDDTEAVLSSALDLSRTARIGIRAGRRTYEAPLPRTPALRDEGGEEKRAAALKVQV